MLLNYLRAVTLSCLVIALTAPLAEAAPRWTIVAPEGRPDLAGAVQFLERELGVRARGGVLARSASFPAEGGAIALGSTATEPAWSAELPSSIAWPDRAEGYAIWSDNDAQTGATRVYCAGADARGVLFAAAHLLRQIDFAAESLVLPEIAPYASAPVVPLRGHQLGYRDTANAYDAWDLDAYDQYIRDLIAFGTNAIELIPSVDPEEKDSVHMKTTMWDMTIALSELIHSYGLEVWLWVPVAGDVADPAEAMVERAAWKRLFDAVPHVDGVFVPGGDPGHTDPAVLMVWMEDTAPLLHNAHPDAGLWISNQGFDAAWNDVFFNYLNEHQPKWFAGAVFGPWAKITIQEMRERTPAQYPIRRYPDITHNVRCQYPVPDWDPAFAHTLGRESHNTRPRAMKHIHNVFLPYSDGFITYSDGINDDVNKMLWSALGWNPEADTAAVLAEYGRYFIGHKHGEAVARGLQGLEDNWVGPIDENPSIAPTAALWRGLAESEPENLKKNWRFQLIVLRALYDDYVQQRARAELARERAAVDALRAAADGDLAAAMAAAKIAFAESGKHPELAALRKELDDFGGTLFKLIGMQLDVKRYKGKNPERGAILEFLDTPLNDRAWWVEELSRVESGLKDGSLNKKAARERVLVLCDWDRAPEGGFYDDLGRVGRQPHLAREADSWEKDPGGVFSPMVEFSKPGEAWRMSWADQAQTLYGAPLKMRYEGLDPEKNYTLRVVYAGRFRATMRLTADGAHEVHAPLAQPDPIAPLAFSIPREATGDGVLELQWDLLEGRGCQVAEVWLYPEE